MTDKQPEALKWADAAQSAHMPQLAEFLRTQHAELMQLRAEVAALSANALDDCRHIERKDALLRKALETLENHNGNYKLTDDEADVVIAVQDAIKKELAK